MKSEVKKRGVQFGASVLVLFALVILVMLPFYDGKAGAEGAPDYQHNEDGLTYGSPLNTQTGEMESVAPDLSLVETEEGTLGYVYTAEFNEASDSIMKMSANELDRLVDRQAEALCSAGEKIFGFEVVDANVARRYVVNRSSSQMQGSAEADIVSCIESSIESSLLSGDLSEGAVADLERNGLLTEGGASDGIVAGDSSSFCVSEEALNAMVELAKRETAIPLDVYENDGETVVGVFYVATM